MLITTLTEIKGGEFYEARNVRLLFGCKSGSKMSEIVQKVAQEFKIYPVSNKPKIYEGTQIITIFNLITSGKLCHATNKKKKSQPSFMRSKEILQRSTSTISTLAKKPNITIQASFGKEGRSKLQANHFPTL